jgi:WhiB family redox-sensing transcriptional regulator
MTAFVVWEGGWDAAECRGAPTAIFYPEQGTGAAAAAAARRTCAGCSLRVQCVETAVATGEHHGIWGGLTVRERPAWAALVRRGTPKTVALQLVDQRRQKPALLKCGGCGQTFKPSRLGVISCSKTCADKTLSCRAVTVECGSCGEPFQASRLTAKWCSKKCRNRHHRQTKGPK